MARQKTVALAGKGVEKSKAKPKAKAELVEAEDAASVYDVMKLLDITSIASDTKKRYKLAGATTDIEARRSTTVSTGLLMSDVILGGGIFPSGWYTFFGPEQSAKSTHMITAMAAFFFSNVPYIGYYDAEGSTSPDYLEAIARASNVHRDIDIKKVFGIKDPKTGKYVIEPRIHYAPENSLEAIWKSISSILRKLPDKVHVDGEWWLLFENSRDNQSRFKGQNNTKVGAQYGKIAIKALDGGAPQALFIIDSYPAMVSESDDDDDGDNSIGLEARGHSKHVKKVKGRLKRKHATVIGVNQLRDSINIGNPYGPKEYEPCFIGSTPVLLENGQTDTIRNIVLNRKKVKVMSFNPETGEVSAKRIIDWKNNGPKPTNQLVRITYQSYGVTGERSESTVVCTKNHKFWTTKGWKKAGDLTTTDCLMLNTPTDEYNKDQRQVLYGSLLGDGVFSSEEGSLAWNLLYSHVRYQVPYMMWKAQMIDYGDPFTLYPSSKVQKYRARGKISQYQTHNQFSLVMAKYAQILKSNHTLTKAKQVKAISRILGKLDTRGLAIWYQDDGYFANDAASGWVMTISCDRFSKGLKDLALKRIQELTGVTGYVNTGTGKLTFTGKETCLALQDALAGYMHPSMAWKVFDCPSVGGYGWDTSGPEVKNVMTPVKVLSVAAPVEIKSKTTAVYDLTIEDNHTYFVGGVKNNGELARTSTALTRVVKADAVAVSNCGNALKFYADCRISQRPRSVPHGSGQLEEEPSVMFNAGNDTYRYVLMRAIKNKFGAPYLEAYQRIWVSDPKGAGHGFCPVYDTWNYLKSTGQVEGTMGRKFSIQLPDFETPKITWLDFKCLILYQGKDLKDYCAELGITKPPRIRERCFEQLRSGDGLTKYFNTLHGLEEEDEEDVPYTEWSNADLIEEISGRGLTTKTKAKKMNKEELIELLEVDDGLTEDDEEEEESDE